MFFARPSNGQGQGWHEAKTGTSFQEIIGISYNFNLRSG